MTGEKIQVNDSTGENPQLPDAADHRFDALIETYLKPDDDAERDYCRRALDLSSDSYWNHRNRLKAQANVEIMGALAERLEEAAEILVDQRIMFRLMGRMVLTRHPPDELGGAHFHQLPEMMQFAAALARDEAREIEESGELAKARKGGASTSSVKHTISTLVPVFEKVRDTRLGETEYDPDNWAAKRGSEVGGDFHDLVQAFFYAVDPELDRLSPKTIAAGIGIAKRDAAELVRRMGRNAKKFNVARTR